MLPGFSCRDLEAVLVKYNEDEAEKSIVMCPAFWFQGCSPTMEFGELVQRCEEKDLTLVIGCDSNPQNTVWASIACNNRWVELLEFINSSNSEILNQGTGPTFCNNRRLEVLHFTLGSFVFMEIITGWEVSSEPSLSGHRYMQFNFEDFTGNPQRTGWDFFQEDLKGRLEQGS
jgi:hypothetical protein